MSDIEIGHKRIGHINLQLLWIIQTKRIGEWTLELEGKQGDWWVVNMSMWKQHDIHFQMIKMCVIKS